MGKQEVGVHRKKHTDVLGACARGRRCGGSCLQGGVAKMMFEMEQRTSVRFAAVGSLKQKNAI